MDRHSNCRGRFMLRGIPTVTVKHFRMENPSLDSAAENKQSIWQYLKLRDKLSINYEYSYLSQLSEIGAPFPNTRFGSTSWSFLVSDRTSGS